jgi:hypothetical protein
MAYNPTVRVGSDIVVPEPPNWVRTSYTRVQYSQLSTFVYPTGSTEPITLSGNGGTFYLDTLYFDTLKEHLNATPQFMDLEWATQVGTKLSSGILTPQNSIMTRPLVPNQRLVDNGFMNAPVTDSGNFNWESYSMYGKDESCWTAGTKDKKAIVLDDANLAQLAPSGVKIKDLDKVDEKFCLGGGAFQLVVNIKAENAPVEAGQETKVGNVKFTLGDLEMILDVNGNLTAKIAENTVAISIPEATGSQVLPQAQLKGYNFFVISVYPCWNGVCIQSGIQTSPNMISGGGYVPKKAGAGMFDYAKQYNIGDSKSSFDPRNPAEVKIESPPEVTVTLGGKEGSLDVEKTDCSVSVAFAPLFFIQSSVFAHCIRGSIGVSGYTYTYTGYPIWTNNNTAYVFDLESARFQDTGIAIDGAPNSHIFKSNGKLSIAEDNFQRVCGEVLGMIIEMKEEIAQPYPNSKGEHPIKGDQERYIKAVTSSYNLDASSGSVSIDMFGANDKNYEKYIQSVGALTVQVFGWEGLNGQGGRILAGYSWCANEIKNASGFDVELSVKGVETRLDEVNLINPPIMDGYLFSECASYICQAAGVAFDLTSANDIQLQMTTDINSVIYNWTTGITCKAALEQICKDTANRWFPYDGKIIFYALDSNGAPKNYVGKQFSLLGKGIQQYDARPDFDNIRNTALLIAMEKPPAGKGRTFPESWPMIPIMSVRKQVTDPVIPWQKGICYTYPGFTTQKALDKMASNVISASIKYDLFGSVTIPGRIVSPLDKVTIDDTGSGETFTVVSVQQNVNLESKSWTTSLELMR